MHFKGTGGNQKVLIRALSAITALLIARSEVFEIVILVLGHRIVPSGNCHVAVMIFILKVFERRIFTRQACRRDRFRVLDPYITILQELSVKSSFSRPRFVVWHL